MEDIWIQSATDIIGKTKMQKTKPWISDQVVDMAVKKRETKKKGNHIEYNRLKRDIQRMIRRDKNAWLEKECAQIDEYDRFGKARAMYNKVKSVKKRPFHANEACINDNNSITLTDPEEVLDRWHEYGANLFGKPEIERPLSTRNPGEQELGPCVYGYFWNRVPDSRNGRVSGYPKNRKISTTLPILTNSNSISKPMAKAKPKDPA